MSTNTLSFVSCLHDTLRDIGISTRLHEGQSNACPCYHIVQLVLDHLHHWLPLPETQCHGSPSAIAGEWTQFSDSSLDMFDMTKYNVEVPIGFEAGSPSFSGPSPMESDVIHQPYPNTALDPNKGIDASYLSGPGYLEGCNFNPEPSLEFFNNFSPELSMSCSMDDASSQTWNPYALPQSPDGSSSDESSSCYYPCQWNEPTYGYHVEPSSNDIQPHTQNSANVHISSFGSGADLHSPTPSWPAERKSDCTLSMDDMNHTSSFCGWDGGSCLTLLTVDKSEVAKHLQLHGVKPGGDKEKILCQWEGCGKEMKKESISRHIIAVHLDNKTECDSCGKKFARLDSKRRHLKNSNREGCRESESYDTRAKRRRLSLP